MSIINGYSYGRAVITTTGDIPTSYTVDFPVTNYGGGLEETLVPRDVKQEFISLNIESPSISRDYFPIGFDMGWTFHYEDFITGNDLYNKFYLILKAWKNKWTIKLTPRIDVPERFFYVHLVNESLSLMIRRGGTNAKYHKGPMFSFLVTETQPDPNWYLVPEPSTTFGVIFEHFVKAV